MLDKNVGDYSIAKVKTRVLIIIQAGSSGKLKDFCSFLRYPLYAMISCKQLDLVINKCKENLVGNNPKKDDDPEKDYLW